ncbi:MAG: Gldg family protein, partial [Candidatus Binatia bacterium]
EKITNAVIKVTSAKKKTVCLVEGHGEPDAENVEDARAYGQLNAALVNESYEIQRMLLATQEEPPTDCAVMIVPAGEKPWLEPELALFKAYLAGGGRAIVLFSARKPTQLTPILAEYGVQVGEDVVVDQVIRLFQGPALGVEPIANTYAPDHPITEKFNQRTIFPLTRSVEPAETAAEGVAATALVKSGQTAWAESDLKGVFEKGEAVDDEGKDRKGPITLAVAATIAAKSADAKEGEAAPSESRLVVFGSDEFANNKNLQSFYNRDLILNAVGWAAGEENLVSIRPRGLRSSRVQLTAGEMTTIFYLSVLGLPELLLLIGVVVSLRRRGA